MCRYMKYSVHYACGLESLSDVAPMVAERMIFFIVFLKVLGDIFHKKHFATS